MKEVKEDPFVGEETVVIFLEGEKVVEVVLKVMVEMEEVAMVVVVFERKGLPRTGIFLGIFFGDFFPTVPSPLQIGGGVHLFCLVCCFFSSSFWMLVMLRLLVVLVLLMSLELLVLLMTLVWYWVPVKVVPVFLVILVLLVVVVGPWFVSEEGGETGLF